MEYNNFGRIIFKTIPKIVSLLANGLFILTLIFFILWLIMKIIKSKNKSKTILFKDMYEGTFIVGVICYIMLLVWYLIFGFLLYFVGDLISPQEEITQKLYDQKIINMTINDEDTTRNRFYESSFIFSSSVYNTVTKKIDNFYIVRVSYKDGSRLVKFRIDDSYVREADEEPYLTVYETKVYSKSWFGKRELPYDTKREYRFTVPKNTVVREIYKTDYIENEKGDE